MLTPAPSAVEMPTTSAVCELLETAAAKIGASVETVPSIIPTSPGCTIRNTNPSSSKPVTWASARVSLDRCFGCVADPTLIWIDYSK